MAKITLGATPKNFKKTVKVTLLDGTQGTIDCTFIYRTVTQYGELIDKLNEGGSAKTPEEAVSLADLFSRNKEKNGDYICQILEDWGMEAAFTPSNAQQLCDEYPGVAAALFEAYRNAIVEGRLGN